MLPYSLEELDEEKIRQLCVDECPESFTLDFKALLPKKDDESKEEFLKDICAFANADGGDLVYGVSDKGGVARSIIPLSSKDAKDKESADEARRRLGQILDAGVEPRLQGIQFKPVLLEEGGYVLVIRVSASFDGPHGHKIYKSTNEDKRFVMRRGTHTSALDYDQLRAAFDRTATLNERARKFKDERLKALIDKKAVRSMEDGPICVVHLVPMVSMSGRKNVDPSSLYDRGFLEFSALQRGSTNRTLNLDGLLVYSDGYPRGNTCSYTQIFRSGAIETVACCGSYNNEGKQDIPSNVLSDFCRKAIQELVKAAKRFECNGPAIVSVALLHVKDLQLHIYRAFPGRMESPMADREHFILPERWVPSIEAIDDIDDIVRPFLDILWQAFGLGKCSLYNEEGVWQLK